MDESIIRRFCAKIKFSLPDRCWLWQAGTNRDGYGSFYSTGYIGAHRFAYELWVGPLGDLHALHTCDVRSCVNPTHIFKGTNLDNIRDKVEKGRSYRPIGELSCSSVVTENIVRSIRSQHSAGYSQLEISIRHRVTPMLVHRIVRFKTWKHVR